MTTKAPFRLAFREEGEWVSCYLARTDTMDDATLIGTMRRSALFEPIWTGWKQLMRQMLQTLLEADGITVAGFGEESAPEHERSGRA